jgi:hypothetical protein
VARVQALPQVLLRELERPAQLLVQASKSQAQG